MKTKRVRVAKTSDLAIGEMEKVKAGRNEILLRKIDDRFYAGVVKCPHHCSLRL